MPVFRRHGERFLARSFHAVRLSRSQRPELTAARERPLVVYLNHASWWDPLVCLQLASQLLPGRRHYAPIEQAAFSRHPLFARLGFFAVDPASARGARRFLETAARILEQPGATLWITAGGALADPRERPVTLQPGLGHLAVRLRHGTLLPLALEYPFWTEPLPEALACFGEELAVEDAGMRAHGWAEVLAARLEAAQDALAAEASARDAARFEVMQGGGERGGTSLQDAWRRLRESWRAKQRRPMPRDTS
jgi:1-acyl-sn-glycerol-3-phosphate acyltransferase